MIAEFDWWLLIVGLGTGAALTWLILADLRRREDDLTEAALAAEVSRIERALADDGRPTSPETIRRVLEVHAESQAIGTEESSPEDPAGGGIAERPAG